MIIVRSLAEAAERIPRPVVATLGVFDGVHRGHQRVLARVLERSKELEASAVVVSFARHPRAVIEGKPPKLLCSLRHRLRLLEEAGMAATLLLRFDAKLRSMPAEVFAKQIFRDALGARGVVLGYDNRFGLGARGDIALLQRLGKELGFQAEQVPALRSGDSAVSSTRLREAILEGRLEEAASGLGRPVSVVGNVVLGERLGRALGFPTANLNLHHAVRPPRGVYGARVQLEDQQSYFGLVNIGVRPTLRSETADPNGDPSWEDRDLQERFEVHLLGYEGDLYGTNLEVEFLVRLREEKRFSSLQELKQAIASDRDHFRRWREDAELR